MAITTYRLISGSEANCAVTPVSSPDGNFTITPGSAATTWSFRYEIFCDGVGSGATATVSGQVAQANPVAVDDIVGTALVAGVATAVSVQGNDTVCPAGITSYVLRAGTVTNATVTPATSTNGTFNVTPTSNAVANWSFDYELYCNGAATGEIATVSGTVAAAVPIAVADTDTTPRPAGVSFNSSVSANDTPCGVGATTYVLVAGSPVNCAVTGSPSATGTFSVTPTAAGAWSYRYEIYCGGVASGQQATVTGSTTGGSGGGGTGPVAVGDSETTKRAPGTAFSFNVSGNDTVCATGATTYRLVAGSADNCTVTGSPSTTGAFTVTPGAASCDWSFDYEILCAGTASGQVATASGKTSAPASVGAQMFTNADWTAGRLGGINDPANPAYEFATGWLTDYGVLGPAPYGPHVLDDYIAIVATPRSTSAFVVAFPGDAANGEAAATEVLLFNGTNSPAASIFSQSVNLVAGRTYRFAWYGSNATDPNETDTNIRLAEVQLHVNGVPTGASVIEPLHGNVTPGVTNWYRHAVEFTAATSGATTVALHFIGNLDSNFGNDLALTNPSLREVVNC